MTIRKMLVVDDEAGIRENLCDYFTESGFVVSVAQDGRSALELIKGEVFDIVISDVKMPNGSGIYILEELERLKVKPPVVIMVTGFAEITKGEALEKGASELILKPFNFSELEDIILKYFPLH